MIKKLIFTIFVLLSTSANSASLSLNGDTIDASINRTIYDSYYGIGRVCCYGLDAPFVVHDGTSDQKQYSGAFTLDVDGDKFSINFITSAGWQDGIVFRLDDLNFSPVGTSILTGVTVDTNLSGYSLNFGDNFVALSLGGTHFDTNTYFTGHFDVAAVPVPATAWLLGSGLLGLIGVARRKAA